MEMLFILLNLYSDTGWKSYLYQRFVQGDSSVAQQNCAAGMDHV